MAYITNKTKNVTGTSLYIQDAIMQKLNGKTTNIPSSSGSATTLLGQLNDLENATLYSEINNISQINTGLPFELDLTYYSNENPYYDIIYSQDDRNDLKIWFNNVELENAAIKCEKIERVSRILPDDGSKRFSLDNFISTSLEVILHNVDVENIKDQVKISIGTLIDTTNNVYQYIPLGVFNIQDTPENDKGKVTLKLRDNRVKFDFYYNAFPLIEEHGGSVTKMQILNDICEKADVENTITSFNGDSDLISIFDNTISGSTYIAYLMEQAGLMPIIDRQGRLAKIDLNDLYTWKIPLSLLETGFEIGDSYKVDRVVYESGIIKYETSDDETLDTLYLDSANPYITNQSQINHIYNKLKDFEIDSVITKRALGNPAIDPYDLIQVYNDLDGTNDIVFTTLANTNYTYNGKHIDTFDTQIGKEERTENVTLKGEESFKKYAKTEINNINAEISLISSETKIISDKISGVGSITLQNAYVGTLHRLEITGDIHALTPNNTLYPSATLYPIDTTIIVDNTKYYPDFEHLNYISSNVHDKYVYEDGKQWVERNVGVDGQGNLYPLPSTIIEQSSKELVISVNANSTILMQFFQNAILSSEYLLNNDYTDVFAPSLDLVAKINLSPGLAEINAQKISLAGKHIDLTSEDITINSNYFKVDKYGNMECTSAKLGGVFRNYDKNTGKLAIEINNSVMRFYDYKGSYNRCGGISSTRNTSTQQSGVTLYAEPGSEVVIGYKIDDSTTNHYYMKFDTRDTTKTPWIKNTANGTLFDENPSGGIVVENGLIKSWNMLSKNGKIEIREPNNAKTFITVKDGLIVDWEYQ